MATPASQIEVSRAAFVPICLNAHGRGLFSRVIGLHSTWLLANSSAEQGGNGPNRGRLGPLYPSDAMGVLASGRRDQVAPDAFVQPRRSRVRPSPEPARMVIVARLGLPVGWPRSLSVGRAVAQVVTASPLHRNERVSSMYCPAIFQPIPTNDRMRPWSL